MAKMKKIILAGPLVYEAVYPIPAARDPDAVRAGRRALSSEAQQKMNFTYAWQKLECEIACNFGAGDLLCTFTYDEAQLPSKRAAALRDIKSYWRKLRAARQSLGQSLSYLYCTEGRHGDARLHHHAIVNAHGADFALLSRLWKYGLVSIQPLRIDSTHTYESLARYFCKEQRERVGQRLWSGSRNLKKPERECYRVDDDVSITPPPGALVLEDSGERITPYGHFRFLKFYAPGFRPSKRPKPKRKRRPKIE